MIFFFKKKQFCKDRSLCIKTQYCKTISLKKLAVVSPCLNKFSQIFLVKNFLYIEKKIMRNSFQKFIKKIMGRLNSYEFNVNCHEIY